MPSKSEPTAGNSWTWTGSPRYKWYVVGMLWFISFFNYADRQAIYSVFPLLETEMGLGEVELGLLGSSFAWVYGLCAPFAGTVVDRVRRKMAILGGLHVWSLICMATALSRNLTQLVIFRAAEGLGETIYYPASMSMISDYHGKQTRSRAMGIHQTSVYVGTIAGGFFAALLGQHYGWRWGFVVFGGLGVLLGMGLHRFLIEPERGTADSADEGESRQAIPSGRLPLGQLLYIICGTPTVLVLMLGFVFANFGAMVLLTWMPKFLYSKFEFDLATAGLNATLFPQLASMAGSPLGGWLADRLRKRTPGGRILVQGIAVASVAPFVFLCGYLSSQTGVIVSLTAWGLFKGFYDASIFASVFDVIRPEARGTVAGFMNMVGWLGGGASAPVVIGYLAKSFGLGYAISSAALVYVAAGILLLVAGLVFVKRDLARLQA